MRIKYISIFLLFIAVLLSSVIYISAQEYSQIPQECLDTGIIDVLKCDEYINSLSNATPPTEVDSSDTNDSHVSEPEYNDISLNQDEPTEPGTTSYCPSDCGKCKECMNGECTLLKFGTPHRHCSAGQVCDGHGECIVVTADLDTDSNPSIGEPSSNETPLTPPTITEPGTTSYCPSDCGQCKKCVNGNCVKVPFGTPDSRCGANQVCDVYGGCVTIGNVQMLSEEQQRLLKDEAMSNQSGEFIDMMSPHPEVIGPSGEFTEFLPEQCKQVGISDPQLCMEYMKKQFGGEPPSGFVPPEFRQMPVEDFARPAPGTDFESFMPRECQDAGITSGEECQGMMFAMKMPEECREANVKTPEECEQLMTKKYMPSECKEQDVDTMEECEKIMIVKHLPLECKQQGASTPEECDKIMINSYAPKICQEKGASTDAECEKIVFDSYGRPDECQGLLDSECRLLLQEGKIASKNFMNKLNAELPQRCIEMGAKTFQECEKLSMEKNVPPECKEAGAFTRQACEKVMMEKYQPSGEFLPRACQEAGVTDQRECEKVMVARYFPQECKEVGINNPKDCEIFIAKKHIPAECIEAGATTRESCEEIMRTNYMAPECKERGIFDKDACEQYMKEKYAKSVKCEGISEDECQIAINKRHLGQIVKKQKDFKEIKEGLREIIGEHIVLEGPVEEPPEGIEQPPATLVSEQAEKLQDLLPLVPSAGVSILVLSAKEEAVITKDESLIQTLPVVVMLDSDQDGLPDDVEEHLGTDPSVADSDGDGFDDLAELQNNSNPLGDGVFDKVLEPIEEAIINQEKLSHPLIEGELSDEFGFNTAVEESDEFEIDEPENDKDNLTFLQYIKLLFQPAYANDDAETENLDIVLSGYGPAGKTISLYIYSDLPIIITTQVDKNGSWSYTIDKSLVDGEHKVYIALNDSSGNIVKRSKPMSFFVKQARAVTVDEFIAEVTAPPAVVSETHFQQLKLFYLIGTVLLIIVGLTLIIIVARFSKRKSSL